MALAGRLAASRGAARLARWHPSRNGCDTGTRGHFTLRFRRDIDRVGRISAA